MAQPVPTIFYDPPAAPPPLWPNRRGSAIIGTMTAPEGNLSPPIPANPWFSQEELNRFAECLTGDSDRDQACFRSLLATVSELLGETDRVHGLNAVHHRRYEAHLVERRP